MSDAGAHVEDPGVLADPGGRQEQRLVVDEQLEHRGVGDVDHRLADPSQAVGLLGVHDRPGLVEPADERARAQRRPALVEGAPDAEVAVGQREHRLGPA